MYSKVVAHLLGLEKTASQMSTTLFDNLHVGWIKQGTPHSEAGVQARCAHKYNHFYSYYAQKSSHLTELSLLC